MSRISAAAAAVLLLLLLLAIAGEVSSSPPGPVVTCRNKNNTNCTVTNGYGTFPDRTTCRVAAVVYPSNETELLAAVSAAASKKQKMKAVTVYAHSMPKLSCPGGPGGEGLAISTSRLNRTVRVDAPARLLTVQAGITLKGLIDAAAGLGLAVPYTPYWQGMTLGGLIGTGSHGSSLFGKGSAVHEYVVGVRMVVPTATPVGGYYAKVVELGEGDADLLAVKVSLGVLGVIFEVIRLRYSRL